MKITVKGLILVLILLSGNLIFGCMGLSTDDQFKHEWQNSESSISKELDQVQMAIAHGDKAIDYNALSYHSGEIVKITDKESAIISDIPVSDKYSEAKREYLSALTDLRSGYVQIFIISDSEDKEMLVDLISSGPYLKNYIEKRDRVKTIIELAEKNQ
ncbi:MAG: hypothetical protein WCJ93_01845 [Methanomicrobiales archaeon]